jgi:2-deoxy-D-gluconate 3-dehydrogenase
MKFSKFNLKKNTALITGGSGLLGTQHARALLESGAKVVITDIDEAKLNSFKKSLLKEFDESKIFVEVMDVTNES